MRPLWIAALALAATGSAAPADPPKLTQKQMDQVTAGAISQNTSVHKFVRTKTIRMNGRDVQHTVVEERVQKGDSVTVRRAVVRDNQFVSGSPSLYHDYRRDQALARRIADALSGRGGVSNIDIPDSLFDMLNP